MSYNNGAVMTASRRRQGAAPVQSTGRAASDRRKPASGETAGRGRNVECRMTNDERRAVMVGHTVRILADYDGLKGRYGVVVGSQMAGGPVLVKVTGSDRQVCFGSYELLTVPMNDAMLDQPDEETLLVIRAVRLRMWPSWDGKDAAVKLQAAAMRRAERLVSEIAAIRRAGRTLAYAQWAAKNGLSNTTTAIVPWTGGRP